MTTWYTCPQGHRWEAPSNPPPASAGPVVCPVCGAADAGAAMPLAESGPAARPSAPLAWQETLLDPACASAAAPTAGTDEPGTVPPAAQSKGPASATASERDATLPPVPLAFQDTLDLTAQPSGPASDRPAHQEPLRRTIGRYRVEKILGAGSFGVVYLAHDDQLKRRVAIKVPLAQRIDSPEDAEEYLVEAQILASLDHPHIVPVYDCGCSEKGLPFVVAKFIEGCNLAQRTQESRLSVRESVLLVIRMAEALQYAHELRLVHRDVKPGNILLDANNKPFLADFGLALKEADFGIARGLSGTPAYMSPEQANGEGHLVDGRSDIFSLGVVLYELLTGVRPFNALSISELLALITSKEACPLRQVDPTLPRELERITLKALAKRASDRYATALEFADDLQHWLKPDTTTERRATLLISPKGLRSFDAEDTDFFLELLPGPRDRDGLPETLRFWKSRIEDRDADRTFRVGVIYGPSGCGKSSLVKAGLLPRLADHVRAVYVEATPDDTETRLRRGLQKVCPELPRDLSLREAIAHLRRAERLRYKVVLVVDQFEQWLHGKHNQENAELVPALRQCDGERVQCLVMVRDDFWLAVSRFMKSLEIRVVEGHNSALADLFDLRHARNVLTAFGKAYGTLPENGVLTKDQETFLEKAVSGLAQDGKVISVRLALFAEMVKSKPWTPATLEEMGGTEGVGVTFLEETFSAATAPPEHRYHQKAARAVLQALLPESGTDIKGHMRSSGALLEASGYGSSPNEFDDLIRILDSEIRLLTPTDPEGLQIADCGLQIDRVAKKPAPTPVGPLQSAICNPQSAMFYQLTHDYLVPALRDWLSRKRKETRRGRAELLLEERAAVWNARPEKHQLPSLLQWFQIRWLTAKKNWTPPQRKMMRKATRFHGLRGLLVAVLLAVATVTGLIVREQVVEKHKATQAAGLVHSLLNADTAHVPAILDQMAGNRKWVDPLLKSENQNAPEQSRQKLHSSLALLPVDPSQVPYLHDRLLDADPAEVPVIRDALAPYKAELVAKLWGVVEAPEKGKDSQRLRAAAVLAKYDPDSEKWAQVQEAVDNDLVNVPALHLGMWMSSLCDVRTKLLPHLLVVFRDSKRCETDRSRATDILADYAADNATELANLLMDADEKQFVVIYPKLKDQAEHGLPLLTGEIDKKLPSDLPSSAKERERLAKRQANAAVALLRLNQPEKVWPLLKHSPDPRARSYLIHRLSPMGADPETIIKRLDDEPDATIRRALILSLGEFEISAVAGRDALTEKLLQMYRDADDPGMHGAVEWLLRQWKEDGKLQDVDKELQAEKDHRLERIRDYLAKRDAQAPGASPVNDARWYVNGEGQTMVVIPGPVEFMMGSPTTEVGHLEVELQHKTRINRTFALAAKAVTLEQFRKYYQTVYQKGYDSEDRYTPTDQCPVNFISWYMAARYCNWLSEQEGIREEQRCYEIKGNEVSLKANYLSLCGYRLPTEAEMEYATRAGAVTARYFGETEELLVKYAWYAKNSEGKTWPVGRLKPNDLGLFDVQGNVDKWCQESYKGYPTKSKEVTDDTEDELAVVPTKSRVLRGGSFDARAVYVRSANCYWNMPMDRSAYVGLRPARTVVTP